MAANPQATREAERPFPAQRCYLKGCEREGTGKLHHAGKPRLRSVRGTDGEQKLPIYPMRCQFDSRYKHLHTAYLGPHGEPIFPLLDSNGKRIHGSCWFTDNITGLRVEIESDLPRVNASPEKRRKQSKASKRAWRNPTRKAANIAWATAIYGDPDKPETWTSEQKKARDGKAAEANDVYGDPNAPETWTPEQRAARAKLSEAQKTLWANFTPAERKRQAKRRTAGNSRPEVREKLRKKSTQTWAERNARTLPADLAKQSPLCRKLVPVLIADRAAGGHISNDELRAMFAITTSTSDRTISRVRDYCGVPGPKRPAKEKNL